MDEGENVFDFLERLMSGRRFRECRGIGGELPVFICTYDQEKAEEFGAGRRGLGNRLGRKGVHVLDLDMYDLCHDLLGDRWRRILAFERGKPKAKLLELLQNLLDPKSCLCPEIARRANGTPYDILFLSGMGEVFPYVRTHAVLENLRGLPADRPTVVFYPGTYVRAQDDGSSLVLFGRLEADRYYRAFDIFQLEADEGGCHEDR